MLADGSAVTPEFMFVNNQQPFTTEGHDTAGDTFTFQDRS